MSHSRQEGMRFRAQDGCLLCGNRGREAAASSYLQIFTGPSRCPGAVLDRPGASVAELTFQWRSRAVHLTHEYGDKKIREDGGAEGRSVGSRRANALLRGAVREGCPEKVTFEPIFDKRGQGAP